MAYTFINPRIGIPAIGSITSVASTGLFNALPFPVGTICAAEDPTLGAGEFILLPGVASNIVGSVVGYNMSALTSTLAVNTATYNNNPVAISMAANTSTTALSWYQISGLATVAKTTIKVNPNVALYISATAGKVTSTLGTGLQVSHARSNNAATVASATGTVLVVINRPAIQGSKT